MIFARQPQESYGFQRLLICATKPLEVATADSCGCLDSHGHDANISITALLKSICLNTFNLASMKSRSFAGDLAHTGSVAIFSSHVATIQT
jgi:hypothetical protein